MSARSTTAILALAAIGGVAIGVGSAGTGAPAATSATIAPPRPSAVAQGVRDVAVGAGLRRAREPRAGDRWGGCHDARAAGTAPIYRDEPGYRPDMDGDGDGIACEAPRA